MQLFVFPNNSNGAQTQRLSSHVYPLRLSSQSSSVIVTHADAVKLARVGIGVGIADVTTFSAVRVRVARFEALTFTVAVFVVANASPPATVVIRCAGSVSSAAATTIAGVNAFVVFACATATVRVNETLHTLSDVGVTD